MLTKAKTTCDFLIRLTQKFQNKLTFVPALLAIAIALSGCGGGGGGGGGGTSSNSGGSTTTTKVVAGLVYTEADNSDGTNSLSSYILNTDGSQTGSAVKFDTGYSCENLVGDSITTVGTVYLYMACGINGAGHSMIVGYSTTTGLKTPPDNVYTGGECKRWDICWPKLNRSESQWQVPLCQYV